LLQMVEHYGPSWGMATIRGKLGHKAPSLTTAFPY
jgi:hypothetical protein